MLITSAALIPLVGALLLTVIRGVASRVIAMLASGQRSVSPLLWP